MRTAVISLGGEDYSIEYYETEENTYQIYSVHDMANRVIDLTDELEQEIFEKL